VSTGVGFVVKVIEEPKTFHIDSVSNMQRLGGTIAIDIRLTGFKTALEATQWLTDILKQHATER
jgi:hypothetical protein